MSHHQATRGSPCGKLIFIPSAFIVRRGEQHTKVQRTRSMFLAGRGMRPGPCPYQAMVRSYLALLAVNRTVTMLVAVIQRAARE